VGRRSPSSWILSGDPGLVSCPGQQDDTGTGASRRSTGAAKTWGCRLASLATMPMCTEDLTQFSDGKMLHLGDERTAWTLYALGQMSY
jgi:hypothetical protein